MEISQMIEAVFEKRPSYMVGIPDYDGLWKRIIGELFEEFMLFFAPDLHKQIDFSRSPEFLQQELFQEVIQEKKGKNVADQIIKVHLKNGQEQWILIHVEVQERTSPIFPKRMFRYFYRIYDKFDREVYAIALITDDHVSEHPDGYHYSFHGTTVNYHYNFYKFHEHDIAELEQSDNPFAAAVIAGKYANQFKHDEEKRFHFKRQLMIQVLKRYADKREKSRHYLSVLLYFIDYLMQTPEELKQKLKQDLIPYLNKEEIETMEKKESLMSPTLELICEDYSRDLKVRFAKNLIAEGLPNEKVAKLAELELEEVVALKE